MARVHKLRRYGEVQQQQHLISRNAKRSVSQRWSFVILVLL